MGTVHGFDRRQTDGNGEAVEVHVRVVPAEAVPAVLEHAEDQAPPTLGMQRAVEEGAALDDLPAGRRVRHVLERDRQRVVARGGLHRPADGLGGLGLRRLEADGGAVRPGRGVVGLHLGLRLAQEMLGGEVDPPTRHGFAVRAPGPGRDGAAAPREAEHAHPGGVLAADQVLVPAVLAERQQHGGLGDAGAVVRDRDGQGAGLGAADGDADAGGAAPAAVLKSLGEGVREPGGIHPRDAADGALMDAGADGGGGGIVHGRSPQTMRKKKAPRGRVAGGALRGGQAVSGRGAGTRGFPAGPRRPHGR